MGLTLAELMDAGTTEEAEQQVLDGLAGRSLVTRLGIGTGAVALSGRPTLAVEGAIKITTAGEPGDSTSQFEYSVDDQATWEGPYDIPDAGVPYALGATGVSLTFSPGPVGSGVSFVLDDLYTFTLSYPNLPATSWQDGSVPKTLALIQGNALADQRVLIADMARGGFVTSKPGETGASGSWLSLTGKAKYDLDRNEAVATVIDAVLTDTESAGPFTVTPGQLWIANSASLLGSTPLRYTNVGGGVLPLGGTLTLSFQAESPGAAYNSGDGTVTTLLTTLPGVTVNNLGPTSITVQGNDEETDLAYSLRCIGRWATLGTGSPVAAYDTWARTASAEVTRTRILADDTVAGQIDIFLAGASGPVSAGAVTDVETAILPKVSFPAALSVQAATGLPVTITAEIFVYAAQAAQAQAACEAALALLLALVEIGDDPGGTPKLYLSQIVDALQTPSGVRNVELSAPAVDVELTTGQVATLTGTRTYTPV